MLWFTGMTLDGGGKGHEVIWLTGFMFAGTGTWCCGGGPKFPWFMGMTLVFAPIDTGLAPATLGVGLASFVP